METNSFTKTILVIIAGGIWALVLQNAGVIETEQDVYVSGGNINSEVSGSVEIDDFGGILDVNIHEINGHRNAFYRDSDGDYILIPVVQR